MAAEMQPRHRLLPRVATLREGDVRRVEARLCRQDPAVDLAFPARDAALDPAQLELVLREGRLEPGIEGLPRTRPVGRKALPTAEDERGRVLLGLDLALRAQAHPRQLRAHSLAQSRLGQEEEV